MKAILATTMLALLVLGGFLYMQFSSSGTESVQPEAMATAPAAVESTENTAETLFTPAPATQAPAAAVQTQEVAVVAPAEPIAPAPVEEIVSQDDGQIDSSLLPQPNQYSTASVTAEGREIGTMNKIEVLGALDSGADKIMALREKMKQAKELGDTNALANLRAQHGVLETELLSLANRGVVLNKAN